MTARLEPKRVKDKASCRPIQEELNDNPYHTCENVMNVVYDCGVRSNQPLLEQEIDGTFAGSNRPHVDFLFISHLDKDHVSGIKYMIAAKYIDDMTTFVLPLYKDYI